MEKPNPNDVIVVTLKDSLLKIKRGDERFQAKINKQIQPGRYFLHHMIIPVLPDATDLGYEPKPAELKGYAMSYWWKAYAADFPPTYYPSDRDYLAWDRDLQQYRGIQPPPNEEYCSSCTSFFITGRLDTNFDEDIVVHSKDKAMSYLAGIAYKPVKVWPVRYDRDGTGLTYYTRSPIVVYNFALKWISVF